MAGFIRIPIFQANQQVVTDNGRFTPAALRSLNDALNSLGTAINAIAAIPSIQAALNGTIASSLQQAIATSYPVGMTLSVATGGTVTISNHTRRYTDGHADVAITGGTIVTGLGAASIRSIGYDDPDRLGGAVTYILFLDDIDAHSSVAHPGRHYVGFFQVPESGDPPAVGGPARPPGGSSLPPKLYDLYIDGGGA